ncbi:MAG: hydrogenase maturation nickel metallochaperone HypA [Propionibacteriaceae bacterium]|jgi:hydrogenase nickel incorporation protein HypA/HybF|nr:hydrogenase maturation nickel metallochaperone HypA [Propionibacteriaceae bacterium]
MHELSLCRSIAGIARRAVADRKVRTINLDIGELRQVVPETLAHCWQLVAVGTALAGSRLEVNRIPAVVRCLECATDTTLSGLPILRCASCQATTVEIVSGEEFTVTSIDVEV